MAVAGITFGVAARVVQRYGWGWGLVAAVLTAVAVFSIYSLFRWVVGFLPYPLGKPKQPKQ